eukprot:scaffold147166_cov44-Attheya_sp.AAC.1
MPSIYLGNAHNWSGGVAPIESYYIAQKAQGHSVFLMQTGFGRSYDSNIASRERGRTTKAGFRRQASGMGPSGKPAPYINKQTIY